MQAGITLCCLGCAIFGISEVPDGNGVEFNSGNFVGLVDGMNSAENLRNTTPISPSPMNNDAQLSASMEEGSNQSQSVMEIRELD